MSKIKQYKDQKTIPPNCQNSSRVEFSLSTSPDLQCLTSCDRYCSHGNGVRSVLLLALLPRGLWWQLPLVPCALSNTPDSILPPAPSGSFLPALRVPLLPRTPRASIKMQSAVGRSFPVEPSFTRSISTKSWD
jgi:hypothetical protein